VTVSLDPATGALAGPFCPRRVQEELPVWRAPLHTCTVHRAAVLVRDQRPAPAARNWRLSDLLLSGDPGGPSPALRGDVTLLFGKGGRIDASASPPLEVSLRPGARPVPVAPAPTARLQLPGDLP
jgi:hypothetical protein